MPSKKIELMSPAEHEARKAKMRLYCAENREKIRAQARALYHNNKEHRSKQNKGYYQKDRGKYLAGAAKWQKENRDRCSAALARFRERHPYRDREYYLQNKPKYSANSAQRKIMTRQACPVWANKFFIEEAYDLAQRRTKAMGFSWHVDHIVPLRSDKVCGLHVEYNMRVIPGRDNIRKGNRTWPDMWVA